MRIIKDNEGGINVAATIGTLGPGEAVTFNEGKASIANVRVRACEIARRNGWRLTVANGRSLKGKIVVTWTY